MNSAARMQTNGRAMCVHIGHTTAEVSKRVCSMHLTQPAVAGHVCQSGSSRALQAELGKNVACLQLTGAGSDLVDETLCHSLSLLVSQLLLDHPDFILESRGRLPIKVEAHTRVV